MPHRPPSQPASPGAGAPLGVVLCADDYGIAPGVGKAIRDLIARGRLSATSCMTVSPYWLEEGAALKPYLQRADIGLHFTLTDQRPLGPMPRTAPSGRLPSLPSLLLRALARRLDRAEIAAELNRQLDAFEAVLGRPPHYIDGHQHAHQLPVVREVVIEAFRARLGSHGGYLRYCTEPPRAILARPHAAEAMIIHLLGRRLRELGRAAGIPGNPRFSGVHDFSGRRPYGALFASFVRDAAPGLLVMCHPGLADAALAAADRVTTAREAEYRYLLSDAFLAVLRENNLGLSRFASGRPVAS